MRGRRLITGFVAVAALTTASCAKSQLTTAGPNGGSQGTASRGTLIVSNPDGGEAAAAIGAAIAITPGTATTTSAPDTASTDVTTTTLFTVTTPKPTVTTAPPQIVTTTATVTVPQVTTTLPAGKPLPSPASPGIFGPDELDIFNKINQYRASTGLAALTPESAATTLARQHSQQMAGAGHVSSIPNMISALTAKYSIAGDVEKNGPKDYLLGSISGDSAVKGAISQNFAYVGIGIASGGNQLWLTIIVGN